MKSYVSSFGGSWLQRCLSMVLCFCMVLSLCPLPQHAAASEAGEIQEVSQPVETQPAPQPVETQPAPQPVETQPAPQPEQTQPVTQPEETQPVTQPEETQPVTQPEETQEVTQPEETQEVTEPEETQEVTQPVETQEVTEPEETQEVTEPEETQETTEPEETQGEQPLVVTSWQWVDEEEYIDPIKNELLITFASIENPVYLWSILEVLPAEIFATVDGEVVTLTLGEWKCDDYPTAGAYQGEYVFKTTLPEGYVLAEDAAELKITVVFDSIASTLEEEHTHSFDASGVCSCGAMQVRYLDASHAVQTAVCQAVTAETTELTDGWYVAQGNVTIGGSVTATENANLILADGCSLTVGGDFLIQGGKSLNIYVQSGGTGSLTIAGSTGLGVSGSGNVSVGIYGGRIVVTSIGSNEETMTLSSSAGSSAVIYCGGFGYQVDRSGFHGVFVSPAEYGEIWVAGSSAPCCDIVIPQGSEYYMYFEGDASLSFTNGRMLQVPDGSSLRLYGLGSFPNGIAANVDLRTILDDYCAFQDSSGSIIKLSGETSLPGPITLVDKHKCSWQYKDSTAEGHTRYCDECGRSFIEPHRGDMEQGMEKTDINHTYTCDCGAEVTEAHQWEYFYSDANQHEKYCPVCGKSEDIPHDFTSGKCVCGAVEASYADATGTNWDPVGCLRLSDLEPNEYGTIELGSGWYLVDSAEAVYSILTQGTVNLILENGCSRKLTDISTYYGSVTIWQQPGENVGKLTITSSESAVYSYGLTINGGVLELKSNSNSKAFDIIPTLGSCMKLSVKDGNGGYTPVNIGERTSTLSTATDLKLEPCTSHAFGEATEYIDSSYHGIRCQYCGIGGEGKEKHTFDDNGFCTCGAVQFLDESGNQTAQLCQEVTADGNITDGWYVVKGTVNYSGTISGVVNLVLADGCSLNAARALTLANDTRLTVYAQSKDNDKMGKLIANNSNGSGIGGDEGIQLIVTGGSIKATGLDFGIDSGLVISGGIVEAESTGEEDREAFYHNPKISAGMRVVNGEDNTPVSDQSAFFATRPKHVIIQPCNDHPVTKGGSYINENTHYLVCAYCNLTVEGTAEHSFNEKGICSCGAVQYLDENGETNIQLCQVISSGTNLQENGWYVWDGQDENDLYVYGDSNLILTEGSTLTAEAYLHENSLTVYGQPGSCLTLSYIHSDGTLNILGGSTVIDSTYYVDNLSLNVNGGILVVKQVGETTLTVNNQRGIYLEENVGQVAGNFTLSQSFTLEDGQILTIPENAKLTVASPKTRSTSYLVNNGKIYVDGALSGDVTGSGEVYYLVKLPEGVTAKLEDGSNLESYNEKLYAMEGQKIVLTGGTSESYLANGSCVYGATFTMGAEVTEVEVHSHSFNNNDGFCSSCDAYQEPNRDDSGVFQIANAGNLFWFANYCNKSDGPRSARLLKSIVIPEKADGSKREWTPIGTSSLPYTGTFDGQGYSISGLYFNDSSADYVGLFGCVKLATTTDTIQNVTVAGEFTGNQYVGGICGVLRSGSITGCTNNAAVSAAEFIGGICGDSNGKISNCHNSGSIVGQENNSATRNVIGGICGASFGTIERCSNSGAVSAQSGLAGGITGSLSFANASLKDCWNTGSVTGTYNVGGISGLISGCSITGCYSIGTVSGTSDTGPICGGNNGTLTNCYYQASSETDSFDGTTFKTADQFKSGEVAYLLNGDGNTLIWIQNLSGDSYPRLGSDQQYRVYKTDYCPTYSNDEYNTNPHSAPEEGTVCPVCGAQFVASVTVGDVTSYYTTFQGASYAAVSLYNDSTVTLLADVATDYFPDINVIFNLNLNGKTLNVNNAKIYVYEYAVLNVQGTGTLNLQAGNKLHVEGGTVNIQGGAIDGDIQVYNSKEISGNLSISGGSLLGHIVVNGSVLNISGGSVKGNITLNDGKYYAESSDEPWPLYSTLQISGGKFEGNIEDTSEFTEFNITGGEFVNLSYDGNKKLSELPAKDHWFYKTCSESNGEVTYSDLVQYSDLNTKTYTGTGSLYVAEHIHKYTYTNITETNHEGTCECGKEDNGQHKFENGFCTSCDAYQEPDQDASDVYQIANAGNLFWFAAKVNGGSRSISGKLVCEDTITIPEGRTWTPIGNSDKAFAGKFDGNGKTISGLNINASSMFYVGLFGYVGSGGSVSNLTVANSNFYGKNSVGGICGYNKGTITGCTSSANVSGTQSVGGICGNLAGGNIMNCSNSGTVNGSIFVGGICGNNSSSVTNCFNIGTVPGKSGAGSIYGSDNNGNGTASNCYYLAASETDSFDGTTFKTEAQFKSGEVAYLLNNSGTSTTWGQTIGSQDYPVLNGDAVYRALKCDNATVAYYINGTEDITLGHEAPDENGKCPVCHQAIVASVTDIQGTATYYTSLEDASKVADDAEGSTLKLLSNVTTNSFSISVRKKFTLDLNGKAVDLGTYYVYVYGDLTITGGEGSALKVNALQLFDGSTLNIQGGSITGNITGDSSANSVSLNISGGSITGTVETTNATCNISGGSLSNGVKVTDGTLTITGGSINGKVENYKSATLSVTGGEFTELSHNGPLYTLPDDGYWFYYNLKTDAEGNYVQDEEGNYIYENPVPFSEMGTTGENGNAVAGPVYVGPHSHDFVFASIDSDYHDCECTGCQRKYFDGHTDANSDGLCDVCGTIEVHYKDVDGRDRTQRCFPITAETTELKTGANSGWYVVKDDVTINRPMESGRVTVNGTVNLILMDGKSLTINGPDGGLQVTTGQSLNIWSQTNGTGSLICENTNWSAGIGGTKNGACGSVTINGGNITTTGGGNSAGIGGSGNFGSGFVNGTIQINGGTVKATGGSCAPGIGGGRGRNAGTIVINGGTVTATGNNGAPGIGGGLRETYYPDANQDGNGGNVSISNATVIANGIGGPATGGSLSASNSVIITDYTKHQTNTFTNSVVFKLENDAYAGEVYGNVTLSSDLTLDTGKAMTLNMSFNGNVGSLTLTNGAKLILGSGTTLKLEGDGSFPSGVTVSGGYLLDILADGWAFFYDEAGTSILPLTADQDTTSTETDESPLVYLRSHTHSWSYSNITKETHDKTCTCVSGVLTEDHINGSDDFCTLCGAGVAGYVDANGNDMGEKACFAVTASSTTWGEDGKITWYVVKDKEVNISDRINVTGNVNLILAENCTLNAQKGIDASAEGSSITIWAQSVAQSVDGSTGKLIANAPNKHLDATKAAIAGTVTINGGVITASGDVGAADIGGNQDKGASITINGGYVKAIGAENSAVKFGAGIGSGSTSGEMTQITITGGVVYASSSSGAGIGSGFGENGTTTVKITGGTVCGTSDSGAGIGESANNYTSTFVIIEGGTVTACGTTHAFKSDPHLSEYAQFKLSTGEDKDSLTAVDYSARTAVEGYDGYTASKAVRIEPCGTEENPHNRVCKDVGDGIWHNSICNWCGYVEDAQAHTVPGEDGRCTACDALIVASMTANGSTGYYSEFLPAFSAANGISGSTLKLLANVYAERMLEVTGSFTLDLNGKTLESDYFEYGDQDGYKWNNEGAIYVPYGGSLTIQDSSEGKTGKIFLEPNPDLGDDFKNAISVRGGTLNFFGGKVNYRIRNELGTLNISGTAVVEVGSDDTAVRNINYQYSYQKAHATISGGTLIGGDCISAEGYTEVAITGGTFEALAAGNPDDYSSCINAESDSSVTVSGGTFKKEQGDQVYTFRGSNISVSGGEFIDGISVFGGNLKDRLATDENGEIAYWYYQKLEDGVYSDGITAADAAAASYGSTVYVGCHEHDYVSYGDGTCVCGKQIPVAVSIGGETQFFDSLSAAMASLDTSAEEKAQVTVFQSTSFQNDLVIPENVTLTVKDGATLTAENNARLFVRSSLSGSVSGDVRYLVSVNTNEVNVTGRSVTVYLGSVYARADDPINLKAINYDADSMMLTDWLVNNESSSELFTMPSHPVTIERKLEAIVATVTILGNTTPYTNLYSAFDAANETYDNVIIELKADVVLGNDSPAMLTGGDVIFRGGAYTISGPETEADWEHRSGYIGVLSGADLTIESGTIASSAFLHCGSGSSVTVTNGSIDTLIVEGGKLTVENASDEENNPVGNIQVENLEVKYLFNGGVQLKGGSYGTITVPEDNVVSDLLSDGCAYRLTDGTWEDDWNGSYTQAIAEVTVLPVPVTITAQPDATKTMTYGDVESLSVTANREEASYQWYEVIPDTSETAQAKAVTGETGSTLKLNTFNAGTHEFFCEVTVDGYNAVSDPATVTIGKKTLTVTAKDTVITYGEVPRNNGVSYKGFVNGDSALDGELKFTYSYQQYGDVGSNYKITPSGLSSDNYDINFADGTLIVSEKTIGINWSNTELTYNGSAQKPTAEAKGSENGDVITLVVTGEQTNVGSYYAEVTGIQGEKAGNYLLPRATIQSFTIKRAEAEVSKAPEAKTLTYNGSDQELVTAGTPSGGTMLYRLVDGSYSTAIPKGKNAGTYTVYYMVQGDGNHNDSAVGQLDVTISPKKVTFSGITAENKDYDGTKNVTLDNSQLSINGLIDGDDLSVSVTAAFEDANAGQNKTVAFTNPVLTGESAGNYVLRETGNQTGTTATIEPLEISIVDVTVEGKVYDGTTGAKITNIGRLSTNYDGENLTIVSGTASFDTADFGIGKTVSFQGFTLGGSAKGNYQLSGQPASTTADITPATVATLTLKASSATYDGSAKEPVIDTVTSENDLTLTGSDYEVSYQDASDNTVTELKNAGEYTVTVTGKGNFQGTATASYTIEKANAATGTAPKANSLIYNGQAQALVTAGTTEDGTMLYSTTENGEYTTAIPTGTNAGGYEVWYMVQGDSNHNSTEAQRIDVTIAKKSISGATITLDAVLTYNGEEQEQTIESVVVDGLTVTYEVSGNTGTNAGNYKLTVTGNGNFTGTKDMAWSIAKKSIANAEITLGDALTYNGKLQTQSIASVKVDGLTVPAESYVASGNTGTNAGEYTLTVTANGNFIGTKDMAWTIAKKSIADAEITLGAQLTYNGNPQRQSITSVKIDGLNVTYDASGVENTNAGSYTLTVTGNGNFQGEATASYSIAKAKPTVTPATLTITYGTKLSGCDLSGFKASFGGKELPGSFAFDQPETMPHVSDSGATSYKLTFTPEDTVNFEKVPLETKVTVNKKELTVDVAVQDKQYNGTSEALFDGTPALVGVVTGDKVELTYGNPYFTDVAEKKDIAISFTEAFGIQGDDSGNYYLTQPTGITASIYNRFTAAKGEDGSYTVSTNEWTNQDFVVTAQEGFQLSLTNTADGSWFDTLTVTTEGEGDLKFYVRSADGAISKQASEHYKLDKTAPTGSIFFDGSDQTALTPVVLYRNVAVNAEITGNDDRSGVKDLAWAAFKQAQEPSSITSWNTAASFQLTPEDGTERHVYLKVVDNAGNVAYFRANTILFDTTKPSITGVFDGETYYTTQTAAVSDEYLNAVTLNGAAVTLNEDGKTASVKLTGNVDKTYIIKATDKAGNESTVTVIMKPISAITDPVKDLTKDNVTEDDRKTLDELTGILEDLLEPTTDQTEKQKLQDELDKLEELLDVLDEVKEVEELLRDLPDDVEPDVDADTEQKIKDARKALDDLTDHQEDLVEDDLIEKLERLEKELVDYKFLEGDGSTWNRGSGKALRFVGNGRLDKLDKVILDGTALTTGFTKNTPKTTIDLQAAFLQSLDLGEHTLKLVYTDGEAEAKFTVKQSPNYLDLTGNPDFDDQTEVDVGGERYPIEEIGGRYVNLPESGDLLTTYTYLAGNAAGTHDNYPIGMRVFRINRSEDGTTVTEITEFADLLQYSGCSIRVSGKRGIRMITSMTKSNKAALKGKGLAGFTMLEYGTVVQWADTLGSDDLTLNSGNHNYAYKRGVADPVFGTSGGLTQYTNVLVGFDLEECSKDIVMRPYIILQDADGNQYTLYGGLVTRSISYIAWQNRDTYKPGTAAYKYVHELMGDLDTPAEGG